jgi:hypothetical protein
MLRKYQHEDLHSSLIVHVSNLCYRCCYPGWNSPAWSQVVVSLSLVPTGGTNPIAYQLPHTVFYVPQSSMQVSRLLSSLPHFPSPASSHWGKSSWRNGETDSALCLHAWCIVSAQQTTQGTKWDLQQNSWVTGLNLIQTGLRLIQAHLSCFNSSLGWLLKRNKSHRWMLLPMSHSFLTRLLSKTTSLLSWAPPGPLSPPNSPCLKVPFFGTKTQAWKAPPAYLWVVSLSRHSLNTQTLQFWIPYLTGVPILVRSQVSIQQNFQRGNGHIPHDQTEDTSGSCCTVTIMVTDLASKLRPNILSMEARNTIIQLFTLNPSERPTWEHIMGKVNLSQAEESSQSPTIETSPDTCTIQPGLHLWSGL